MANEGLKRVRVVEIGEGVGGWADGMDVFAVHGGEEWVWMGDIHGWNANVFGRMDRFVGRFLSIHLSTR